MMGWKQSELGRSLVVGGTAVLALGIMLLLIKLVMYMAWYAGGVIAAAGLLMLLIGGLFR